jgi:pyrroline-5-carboxylate reductase
LSELLAGTWEYFKNKKNHQTIEDLIRNVTSKWWVTQAGLEYFWKNNWDELLEQVIEVALKKSKDIWSSWE